MKRICLFAGYDSKNIIHDYVVYYLKELSTVADVYYMADNEISEAEKSKISPYVLGAYGFNHKKYDFGSWQELIKIIGWEKLSVYDELILANDSVFGPLYPMKELFEKLENDKEWDVCGMDRVYNPNKDLWYISSYFLVFKKTAFMSEYFKNHINTLQDNIGYYEAVKYMERPFMALFYRNGFTVKSLSLETEIPESLEKDFQIRKVPFLKKKQFFTGHMYKLDDSIIFIKKGTNYNPILITNYMDSYKDSKPYISVKKQSYAEKLKSIRRWIISINIKKHKRHIKIFGKTIHHKAPQINILQSPISILNTGDK